MPPAKNETALRRVDFCLRQPAHLYQGIDRRDDDQRQDSERNHAPDHRHGDEAIHLELGAMRPKDWHQACHNRHHGYHLPLDSFDGAALARAISARRSASAWSR